MTREISRRKQSIVVACAAAAAGIVFSASVGHAQTNLLLNPGFEQGGAAPNMDVPMQATPGGAPIAGWSGWNNWVYPYSAYYTQSIAAHSGSDVGKTFSGKNGGIYQFVNVNAGDNYTASAWFVNSSTDALNGAETDDVRMIFFSGTNGSGSNLGTFVAPIPVSDLTTPDVWTQLSVTVDAPAGAQSVQWMAFFNNTNGSGGALFVDDASLVDNTPSGPANLTWNNTGGSGDGKTWDIGTNQNWNNGTAAATYTDGSTVTFNDTNNNNYAVTLNTTVRPASVTVNNNASVYSIGGSGSIAGTASFTKSGSGSVTLATANSYTGGTVVNGGLLEIARTNATSSPLPTGPVSITGGTLQLATNATLGSQSSPTPTSNINVTSLAISGNGTLDINNNHIIISYPTASDPIASVAAWLKSGYNAGSWTGTGIISTTAQTNKAYGIGFADAADPGNPANLASNQIELMYTLLGDANLDGKVNGADFAILATNFNKATSGASGWDQGDFNYDGKINGADFAALASNFNQGASQAADVAAVDSFAAANGLSLTSNVPEPASAGLLLAATSGLLLRRRKEQN
jgi:autotransporter-associated beta strand protein